MFEINTVSTVTVGLHGSHSSPTTSKDSRIATTPMSGLLNEPAPSNIAESGPGIMMNARTLARLCGSSSAIAGTVDDSSLNFGDVQRIVAHGFPDLGRDELAPDAHATRIDLVIVTARENRKEHKLLPQETVFIAAPGALETGRESGVFHLPIVASDEEARAQIRAGNIGIDAFYLREPFIAQIAAAVQPSTLPILVGGTSVRVWIITLPGSALTDLPRVAYTDVIAYLATNYRHAVNPLRVAMCLAPERGAFEPEFPTIPLTDDNRWMTALVSSQPFGSTNRYPFYDKCCYASCQLRQYLINVHHQPSIDQLAEALNRMHFVLDVTVPGAPMLHPLPNNKAVASTVKWVGQQVREGTLDELSCRLFCSLVRRHDRFLPTFGPDIPYELLKLGFGPSQRVASTDCLYVFYDPALYSEPLSSTFLRMDIGVDQSFANALRATDDSPSTANAARRLQDAVREVSRTERFSMSVQGAPQCGRCRSPLAALQRAQGLAVTATNEGEFHHDPPVAKICQLYFSGVTDVTTILRPPPNHHLFYDGPLLDQIKASIKGEWLCHSCHLRCHAEPALHVPSARGDLTAAGRFWAVRVLNGPVVPEPEPTLPAAMPAQSGHVPEQRDPQSVLSYWLQTCSTATPSIVSHFIVAVASAAAAACLTSSYPAPEGDPFPSPPPAPPSPSADHGCRTWALADPVKPRDVRLIFLVPPLGWSKFRVGCSSAETFELLGGAVEAHETASKALLRYVKGAPTWMVRQV